MSKLNPFAGEFLPRFVLRECIMLMMIRSALTKDPPLDSQSASKKKRGQQQAKQEAKSPVVTNPATPSKHAPARPSTGEKRYSQPLPPQ
jgi:hypothetical protein